jgi:hypothetical protein
MLFFSVLHKKRPRQELPATTWLGGFRIIDIELFGKSYPVPSSSKIGICCELQSRDKGEKAEIRV